MRRLLPAAYAAYLGAAVYLVFWPQPDTPAGTVAEVTDWLEALGITVFTATMVEFALNVVLFVPLTLIGVLLWPRVQTLFWVVLGLAGSVIVEALQLAALPDRSATLTDLASNTLGAVLGVALGRWISAWRGRRTSTATSAR